MQIHVWKEDDPDNIYKHRVPTKRTKFCHVKFSGGNDIAPDSTFVPLWPYSQIKAAIRVHNFKHHGPLSSPISFRTPMDGKCTHQSTKLAFIWNICLEYVLSNPAESSTIVSASLTMK